MQLRIHPTSGDIDLNENNTSYQNDGIMFFCHHFLVASAKYFYSAVKPFFILIGGDQRPLDETLGVQPSELLVALGKGYEGKLAVGKNASRRSFKQLKALMGHAAFVKAVEEVLPPAQAREILGGSKDDQASKSSSFKDHILAMRNKKKQGASEDTEKVLVVDKAKVQSQEEGEEK